MDELRDLPQSARWRDRWQEEDDQAQIEYLREWRAARAARPRRSPLVSIILGGAVLGLMVGSLLLGSAGWIVPAVLLMIPGVMLLAKWLAD